MKKILMILICGFAFTQSIQTKQVEVTITDWGEANIYNSSMFYDSETYFVQLTHVNLHGTNIEELCSQNINRIEIYSTGDINGYGGNMSYDVCNGEDGINIANWEPAYINSNFDNLAIGNMNGNPFGWFPENPITFTFWVKGMFEDELMPDVGDMNLDGNINVVDVVLLVDSILGIG